MHAAKSGAETIQMKLADFIANTSFNDLPEAFVLRLRQSLLDSIGCGLYGSLTQWGEIVNRYARTQGSGQCSIWGPTGGSGVAPGSAMIANATMIHSFEIDDIHFGTRSHPGGVTIPVALALAQLQPVSGRELLTLLAVGYETLVRVGNCQGVSSFNRGWHPTGTAGVFAAAATAGRLLGLSPEQHVHALGIAGTMPCGLMAAQYGAMVKRFYAGHTAWVGYTAAALAKDSFTGIEDIFDAEYGGYPKALSDEVFVDALTSELGHRYDAGSIGYKLFSCVGTNHTALQALTDLLKDEAIDWRAVREIRVRTSEYQVLHSGWDYTPGTVMAAQMNLQYCTAMLLMQGNVFVDQFKEEYLADPEVLALARRVRIEIDPGQKHSDRLAVVAVELADGTVREGKCSAARGHPNNPPGWSEIENKFNILASKIVSDETCRRIVEIVKGIDDMNDISPLTALLAARS